MSNAVVQSAQQLSLVQKRLVMLAVARLNPRAKALPDKAIRITAEDYGGMFGISPKDAYADLKRASDDILKRSIVMHKSGAKGIEITSKYPWLSRADYAVGEGWVAIKFNPEIAPYLTDLRAQFTKYHLAQTSALRSVYSWRLLEQLERLHRPASESWWQVEVEEFHLIMETPKSYRANFAQTRRFVIEPAIEELRAKDGWLIDWKPIKRGRKVHSLRFEYNRDPQGQLF